MADNETDLMVDPQPRPVVHASRWIAGLASIAGAVPTFLLTFGWIDWTGDQVAAYGTFLGVVVGGVSLILGQNAESQVTPISSPQTLVPLVPVADAVLVGEHEEPPPLT